MKPVTEAPSTALGNSTVVLNSNVMVGHTAFNRKGGTGGLHHTGNLVIHVSAEHALFMVIPCEHWS